MNHHYRRLWLFIALTLVISFIVPIASAQDPDDFGYQITFVGRTYDPVTDTTTFTYNVVGDGTGVALSYFDLEIPACSDSLEVVSFSPTNAVEIGTDDSEVAVGIKWDFPLQADGAQIYSITFKGDVLLGDINSAVQTDGEQIIILPGPTCNEAAIDIAKFLSVDNGVTWLDANEGDSPDVTLDSQVSFRLVVTNTGSVPLTSISLSDSQMDVTGCAVPELLEPDAFFECTLNPVAVVEGPYVNTATVSAIHEDSTVTDTDTASYYGGDRPSIRIEKLISNDGNIWVDADGTPGLHVAIGSEVYYQIIVTNDGNVTLSNFDLVDDTADISGCSMPETLEPDNGFTCNLGPFEAVEGGFTNTASVTAVYGDAIVSDTDVANYNGSEDVDDEPPIIIIEGPVDEIRGNIIIIFGIEIELDPDSPLLAVILIGDVIRIEGDYADNDSVIIVIANVVTVINIDIYINDDGTEAWRDNDNCKNPPPPWAPAHGWRRKCE